LIIAPYNTVLNWVAEFDKWLGDDPELHMRVFLNEILFQFYIKFHSNTIRSFIQIRIV
jgi:hypothetical protein